MLFYRSKQVIGKTAGAGMPSRHAGFARAITGRYGRRAAGAARPLGMTLARRWLFLNVVQRRLLRSTVRISPRLFMRPATLRDPTNGRNDTGAPLAVFHTHRLRLLPENELLVRRITGRGRRIEAAEAAHGPGFPLEQPVQQVMRRSSQIPDDRQEGKRYRTAEWMPPMDSGRSDSGWGRQPPAPAAIDTNRLTDQVIQAIDRRIIAQRERMGRF